MSKISLIYLSAPACSGAEDKHGYIWDRHYNICVARLAHDDVVNSVAFSPADQELLLSASDDSTIKVWRSPRMVRLAQAPARPPRPRSLLPSWLSRNKNSTSASSVNGKPWVRLGYTWSGRESWRGKFDLLPLWCEYIYIDTPCIYSVWWWQSVVLLELPVLWHIALLCVLSRQQTGNDVTQGWHKRAS